MIAGVTPWRSRWVVASAKMAAATFAPEEPKVFDSFREVIDERPSYVAIVVNAPIGYLDRPGMGSRSCDRDARALLGRRAITIRDAPSRATLTGEVSWRESHLDAATLTLLPRYIEVASEMSPFRQRTVYSGNPELSFYQLNEGNPLRWSKKREEGREERHALLMSKIPGINRIIDSETDRIPASHRFDAAVLMWSARRVRGHAAKRLPGEGVWDSEGLRTEMVM